MRTIVALNLPKPAKKVTSLAQSIVDSMANNPFFPSPSPPLAKVTADATAVSEAGTPVLFRTKGAREARDVELAVLRLDLVRLAAYVQAIADENPTDAAAIIRSAGMSVKRPSIRTKVAFEAVQGDVSGSVELRAKSAGDRASYEWRYRNSETVWTLAAMTLQSSTVIGGLTPAMSYSFQLRVTSKDGPGEWSQVVSLVVT
jgi:transglutaminase-like putative cysteine protease